MTSRTEKPDVSRRDFMKAAGIGGISATALAGMGALPAEALQTLHLPGAGGTGEKLVITLAPSGRAPNLPQQSENRTNQQHADAALDGVKAGASIVHLRGGQAAGGPAAGGGRRPPDLENWRELTHLVRSRSDVLINYGSAGMTPGMRKPLLTLKPDAGSVLVGHHYGGGTPVPLADARQSIKNHLEAGILPEVEIFHSGDIANMNLMVKEGLLRPPHCVTLFFNYSAYYGLPPTLLELQSRLALLPPDTHWTVQTKGPGQLQMAAYAILMGGHVRTGLENGVELAPGKPATTQAQCVEQIVRLADQLGRKVATPREAREALALPRQPEKISA